MRRYVVLAQDMTGDPLHERVSTDWVGRRLNAVSILRMPKIERPLKELYDGLDLVPAEAVTAAD